MQLTITIIIFFSSSKDGSGWQNVVFATMIAAVSNSVEKMHYSSILNLSRTSAFRHTARNFDSPDVKTYFSMVLNHHCTQRIGGRQGVGRKGGGVEISLGVIPTFAGIVAHMFNLAEKLCGVLGDGEIRCHPLTIFCSSISFFPYAQSVAIMESKPEQHNCPLPSV